jgi:selenocysteine-specific elongation factor
VRQGDTPDIARGMVVATPGSVHPTRSVHATLILAPGANDLVARSTVSVHLGTAAHEAELTVIGRDPLMVRLAARTAFPAFAGQRFVVRRPGRTGETTFGGGRIADPAPLRSRKRTSALFFTAGDLAAKVEALVAEARYAGTTADELRRRLPAEDDPVPITSGLTGDGRLVRVVGDDGERIFARAYLDEAVTSIRELLEELHRQRPLLAGFSVQELTSRSRERVRPLASKAIAALVADGIVTPTSGLQALTAHVEASARRIEVLDRLATCFRAAGLAPPTDEEARTELGLDPTAFRDAAAENRRAGRLRLVGAFHFDTGALDALRESIRRWFASHPSLSPTDLKGLAGGVTRRHAIPLLEWLDQERITKRQGDARLPGDALGGRPRASSPHTDG